MNPDFGKDTPDRPAISGSFKIFPSGDAMM
jgi:hypothetical protein